MPAPTQRIVIAFPFSADHLAAIRAAAGDAFTVEAVDAPDVPTLDAALGPGCVALVAQRRPSDPGVAPDLRWHQALSAGVEHLLRLGPWPPGVQLTNAAGVYAVAIAQYVLAAILRIHEGMDARQALQDARAWPEDLDASTGIPVRGRTVTIIGYGGIGREIARVCSALGMRVLAVTARPERREDTAYRFPGTGDPDATIPERIVGIDGLHAALAEADIVATTVPLTPTSRDLIDAAGLAAMKPTTWIINTGRGPVINEPALIRALTDRSIGGAVLDVFDREPLPADHPLWTTPNTVITPHISGADSPLALSALVTENVARFRDGRPLLNPVDPERGY